MRILDILLSIVGLLLILPIICLASLFIWLEDFKNPIFLQSRVGKGKCFKIIKLRTMSCEKNIENRRITKMGLILRKSSIDELPQLINVLKGEMSLVGVRPDICKEINYFLRQKPGITGLAQISGRSNINEDKRNELNEFWESKASTRLYITILLKTIYYFVSLKAIRDAI